MVLHCKLYDRKVSHSISAFLRSGLHLLCRNLECGPHALNGDLCGKTYDGVYRAWFFQRIKGTVDYDPGKLDAARANLTIDAATVDTRNDYRDKDLKSDAFFDVAKYPTITFVSKKW